MAQVFVCSNVEMKDGDVRIVRHDRVEVGLYRHDGSFYAYRNQCLHQGGPACEGIIRNKVVDQLGPDRSFLGQTYDENEPHIVCPWHGWEYKLTTGECAPDPNLRLKRHEVVHATEASMSSSEAAERPGEALAGAAAMLTAALSDPDRVGDADLRAVLANALRLYAVKAENGMRTPLPPDGGGLTVTDAMIGVTDVLHALNVQLFELSMWQAMTGNCIAPHQRVNAPPSR